MKVRITNGNHWYEHRVGDAIKVCYSKTKNSNGTECFVAKTWNWFWNPDVVDLIDPYDCEIIDESGSDFEDGYELGIVKGKKVKEQELIAEGILEDDE